MRKVLLLGVMALAACQSATDRQRDEMLERVKGQLDTQLPDYPSARFRNVHINDADRVLCGEVNSKNRMGAYGGWTPFITVGNELIIMEGDSVERSPCPGTYKGYSDEDFAIALAASPDLAQSAAE